MELGYFSAGGSARNGQMKYTVNLNHAKSLFRVACQNEQCVRGDFDLSDALARAVSAQDTTVSGEICCEGWRGRATIDTVPCGNILRYQITLGY